MSEREIFLFMVVTRSGVPGSHAASHVEESSTAFVFVPIPLQRTKEEIAKDNVKNHADVASTGAKWMVATRNGLPGLLAIWLAEQEFKIARVRVPILRRQTEAEAVADWGKLYSMVDAILSLAQWTAATRSGLPGLLAVWLAEEEFKGARVRVPILRQQTEVEDVEDRCKLHSMVAAIHSLAQLEKMPRVNHTATSIHKTIVLWLKLSSKAVRGLVVCANFKYREIWQCFFF